MEKPMNERMRFNPAEASAAGQQDAQVLLLQIGPANTKWTVSPAELVGNALAGIIGLAADNRLDECEARRVAFCEIVGPALRNAVGAADQLEALRAKCASLSASLCQAAARDIHITETEGGEL
jgi:hypothetical protein